MADFRAGGAETFPRRFLGALDQTAIGGTILPPRATVDLMDVVEPHAADTTWKVSCNPLNFRKQFAEGFFRAVFISP